MLALATCAGLLLAAPALPEVRWEAPPGCPDEASVRAQIAALLAEAPAGAGQTARVTLKVAALPGGRWRLDATIMSPEGEGRRSLEADRCEALAEAAALLTAIAAVPELQAGPAGPVGPGAPPGAGAGPPVGSQGPGAGSGPAGSQGQGAGSGPAGSPGAGPGPAGSQGPGAGSGPAGSQGPQGAVEPPEGPEVDGGELEPELPDSAAGREPAPTLPVKPRPPRALRATLGLGAGVGTGAMPGASALLRAAAGLRGRYWSVALTQSFWLPRDLPAAEDPRVGGRLWLAATGLRACGIVGKGRVEVPLCAGVEAGVLRGRGIGALASAHRVTAPWAAMSAGPGLHVRVAPRVAVTLGVDLLVMLTRVRFEVSGRGAVCCSATVGATATAGVELRLP